MPSTPSLLSYLSGWRWPRSCCHQRYVTGVWRAALIGLVSCQIDDLREGQNQLSQTVRKMLDEVKEKQHVSDI